MANRLKSAKGLSPNPDALKPEKLEQVSVKELVRDERTHKIAGTVLLLCCLFLFTCFSSYLFTWSEDQSAVRETSIFFPDKNIKIANMLGTFGAWVAHQFFFNGFGLASYLFCILFFVAGMNAVTGRSVFLFWRHLRYVVAGVIYFSVLLAFVFNGYAFPWGGAVGNMTAYWLTGLLGWLGTALVLAVAGLAYFIWRFNPVFKMPRLSTPVSAEAVPEEATTLAEPVLKELKKNKLKKNLLYFRI